MSSKTTTLTSIARGIVTAQPIMILASMPILSDESFDPRRRLASPTPMIEPTRQWEVETARPSTVLERTAKAVPICTAKERDGVSRVIFEPTVVIVRSPSSAMPSTKPHAPRRSTQRGMSGTARMSPPERATSMAARGPIELPRSLPPCAKATVSAERMSRGTNGASSGACTIVPAPSSPATPLVAASIASPLVWCSIVLVLLAPRRARRMRSFSWRRGSHADRPHRKLASVEKGCSQLATGRRCPPSPSLSPPSLSVW
mmetsp:Transcript_17407/g.44564  ORF Transcript_17407/g.44564 Transcript_17407/m.44564 type:complete len:259 (+) Transcript_17407:169-945(+)